MIDFYKCRALLSFLDKIDSFKRNPRILFDWLD